MLWKSQKSDVHIWQYDELGRVWTGSKVCKFVKNSEIGSRLQWSWLWSCPSPSACRRIPVPPLLVSMELSVQAAIKVRV